MDNQATIARGTVVLVGHDEGHGVLLIADTIPTPGVSRCIDLSKMFESLPIAHSLVCLYIDLIETSDVQGSNEPDEGSSTPYLRNNNLPRSVGKHKPIFLLSGSLPGLENVAYGKVVIGRPNHKHICSMESCASNLAHNRCVL